MLAVVMIAECLAHAVATDIFDATIFSSSLHDQIAHLSCDVLVLSVTALEQVVVWLHVFDIVHEFFLEFDVHPNLLDLLSLTFALDDIPSTDVVDSQLYDVGYSEACVNSDDKQDIVSLVPVF